MIKGTFTSVWDNGTVNTAATLNAVTGELTIRTINVGNHLGSLINEYFEDLAGNEYEVCPECHDHIMKTVMNPGIGHDLNEEKECMGGCE